MEVNFGLLYVEGVRLANADRAVRDEIDKGELPPLDELTSEELASLLAVHGTFILSTTEGIEAIEAEQRYRRVPEEERQYRASVLDVVTSFQGRPDIVDPSAASFVLGATEQIDRGANPERGGVIGTGAVRNLIITVTAGAAVASLPLIGNLELGAGGLVAGTVGLLVAGEGLKKSKPFEEVRSLISASIDHASNVEIENKVRKLAHLFRPHLKFVQQVQPKIRRLANERSDFSWLNNLLDWLPHEDKEE